MEKAGLILELKIKTVTKNGTFAEVIADVNPTVQEIAQVSRALLADVMPNITEVAWPKQKIAGYGVGPKKMSEQFCYLAVFENHVNLGFYYGADLDDPANLLEGTGKAMRHIKIRAVNDLQNPAIRQLVEQASTHLPKLKK